MNDDVLHMLSMIQQEMRQNQKAVRKEISLLTRQVTDLGKNVQVLDGRLTALGKNVQVLDGRLTALGKDVQSLGEHMEYVDLQLQALDRMPGVISRPKSFHAATEVHSVSGGARKRHGQMG